MKTLLFDTGPVISIAMNNLISIFEKLKIRYDGRFCITPSVKEEAVDNPLKTKKFKFEAFQNLKLIEDGILEIYNCKDLKEKTYAILENANNIYYAHDMPIKIVHYTEIETVAAALDCNAEAIVVDEFITRYLIENPAKVKERLENKLHTKIFVNTEMLARFKEIVKGIRVIRSIELITVAYEMGFLDIYKAKSEPKDSLLDAVLWGLKLNGCSITTEEIEHIKRIEFDK